MSIAYDILFPMHNVLYFTKHYPLFILYYGKLFISSLSIVVSLIYYHCCLSAGKIRMNDDYVDT